MESIKRSFKKKQHQLMKLLLWKPYHYYIISVLITFLNKSIIQMKLGFFISIFNFFIIKKSSSNRNQNMILIIYLIFLLFCRLESDQILAIKCLFRRKKSKERLSIALCSNADKLHKLPSLIIGKYTNPRCFKNVNIHNLPMIYQNNAKAWILITIFQE